MTSEPRLSLDFWPWIVRGTSSRIKKILSFTTLTALSGGALSLLAERVSEPGTTRILAEAAPSILDWVIWLALPVQLVICVVFAATLETPKKSEPTTELSSLTGSRASLPSWVVKLQEVEQKKTRALEEAESLFCKHARYLFGLWALLYATYSVVRFPFLAETVKSAWWALLDLLGLLTTGMMLTIFVDLNQLTYNEDGQRLTSKKLRLAYAGLALIGTAYLIVVAIEATRPSPGHIWLRVAQFVMGVVGGASICLVVGRLDSKLVGLDAVTTSLLYTYALIQPVQAMFHLPAVHSLATTMALLLKLLLFLVIVWLTGEGRLLYFMMRARKISEAVVAERERMLAELRRHGR